MGESYKTLPEFDTEVMNSHELKLSGDLFWGKDIMLDRLGIKINKRKKRDGVSFFGTSEETDAHGNPINDFIVNLHKNQNPPSQHSIININNNSISKEHASIEFSHELNCYYIKDKESTNGTFLILEEKDSIQIVNEMKFKILETKFSISEVDQ